VFVRDSASLLNKSISVYVEALKRQQAEQKEVEQSPVKEVQNARGEIAETPNSPLAEAPDRQTAKSPSSRVAKRRSVRHGIDLYKDQLVALTRIQFALWRRDDRKPTLRELILAALDEYIQKMKAELREK